MPLPAKTWQLIVDEPAHGGWNMAVDEVLLDRAASHAVSTLRFYSWSEPTLSIGYFQLHRDGPSQLAHPGYHVVRRRSGGGAILHHHDVTYSLAVPVKDRWSGEAQRLYTTVHQALVESLADWGVTVSMYEGARVTNRGDSHYLCFFRRTEGDVVVDDRKVAGSAQRRSRNAIVQHGSVLLATSPFVPQLAGIQELAGVSIDAQKLVENWASRIRQRLGGAFADGSLSARETEKAERYVSERFGQVSWTQRR